MTEWSLKKQWSDAAGYAVALGLCLAILTWTLQLWRANLHVPLSYWGDDLFTTMQVKGVIDHGWYLTQPRLGLPGTCELFDFPLADSLHFLILKGISLGTADCFLVVNLFYLLTFLLTTLTSYAVLRRFALNRVPSLVVSLLFTFLPYHYYRGTGHLFLSAYYLVPPTVLVVLWVYLDPGALFRRARTFALVNGRTVAAIVLCLLISSAGVYYAFFGCFFLLMAGLAGWAANRQIRTLGVAAALIGIILAGGLVNLAPTLIYSWQHGTNQAIQRRGVMDAELYGLKLTHLLLPIAEHRLAPLGQIRLKYNLQQPINETQCSSLGLLGSLGLLFLLARLLFRKPVTSADPERCLSILTASALLLGTVGGLGVFFAFLMPAIRCYNRVSVFLAFFALLALVLCLEKLVGKRLASRRGQLAYQALLLGLLGLGILDQTSRQFVPKYAALEALHENDAQFIRSIEDTLPQGAAVFQLPYFPFPETVPPGKMTDYDHLRGYLHSRHLRWSYGAMKGRPGDAWQAQVAAKTPEDLVPLLAQAGFAGIYVDRLGYEDGAGDLEARLRKLLPTEPLRSRDNRFFFLAFQRSSETPSPAILPGPTALRTSR